MACQCVSASARRPVLYNDYRNIPSQLSCHKWLDPADIIDVNIISEGCMYADVSGFWHDSSEFIWVCLHTARSDVEIGHYFAFYDTYVELYVHKMSKESARTRRNVIKYATIAGVRSSSAATLDSTYIWSSGRIQHLFLNMHSGKIAICNWNGYFQPQELWGSAEFFVPSQLDNIG